MRRSLPSRVGILPSVLEEKTRSAAFQVQESMIKMHPRYFKPIKDQ